MKKIMIVLCCLCLMGCHSMGSLQNDTLDLEALSEQIDEKIAKGEWKMNVLQKPMELSLIEDVYGIPCDALEDAMVKQSLITACDEIALFHVIEGKETSVQDALKLYQTKGKEQESLLSQQDLIAQAELIQLGRYILYVCGEDHESVVQYISSFM